MKNVLIVAVTTVAAAGFILAVTWYPLDQAEITRAVDIMIANAATATDPVITAPATEKRRDDASSAEAGSSIKETTEWTVESAKRIAEHLVTVARDQSISDSALHGELTRRIEGVCMQRGGCDEDETYALKLRIDSELSPYIADGLLDEENAVWIGRLMLAAGEPGGALRVFSAMNLTAHSRTLLVDMMNASEPFDMISEAGFASMMIECADLGMNNPYWPRKLNELIVLMSPSEVADVRYALRRYIATQRRWQTGLSEYDLNLVTHLITDLEKVERGEIP